MVFIFFPLLRFWFLAKRNYCFINKMMLSCLYRQFTFILITFYCMMASQQFFKVLAHNEPHSYMVGCQEFQKLLNLQNFLQIRKLWISSQLWKNVDKSASNATKTFIIWCKINSFNGFLPISDRVPQSIRYISIKTKVVLQKPNVDTLNSGR